MIKKRIIICFVLILVMFIGISFSYSRAYFKRQIEVANANLKVGTLEYTTTINGSTNNRVSVPAHEYQFLDIVINSKNPINSKYSLVYQISPTISEANYEVAYFDNQDLPYGTIESNGTKRIRVIVHNNSTSSITFTFGVRFSLVNNEVELVSGEKEIKKVFYQEEILNGTDPVLSENLIPVIVEDDGTVKKASIYNEWYNYSKQEWANAVVLEDQTLEYSDGDIIPEDNIQSYFVWIPRYKYKLFNMGNYTGLTSITKAEQTIEVVFENKDVTPSVGTKVGDYHSHPAFQAFDSNGFWVGKFETGYKGATTITGAQQNNNNSTNVIIKPNVYSWRGITVGNAFKVSYDYLRSNESHMMKNTEWGAVAYLQHSEYGSRASVRTNNNKSYLTGYASVREPTCGPTTNYVSNTCNLNGTDDTVTQKYNTPTGYLASTTGNISGVYDMSGGAWEYVMGYNIKASTVGGSSGLTSIYSDFFTNKNWERYYDKYSNTSDIIYNARILGDATGEMGGFANVTAPNGTAFHTSSWYGDYGYFATAADPWFRRGGGWDNGSMAGVFTFILNTGGVNTNNSFRVVLAL